MAAANLTGVAKVLFERGVRRDPEVGLLSGFGGRVGEPPKDEEAQEVAADDVEQVRHAVLRERRLVLVLPPQIIECAHQLLNEIESGGQRVPGAAELFGRAFQSLREVKRAIARLGVEAAIAAQLVPELALLSQR